MADSLFDSVTTAYCDTFGTPVPEHVTDRTTLFVWLYQEKEAAGANACRVELLRGLLARLVAAMLVPV